MAKSTRSSVASGSNRTYIMLGVAALLLIAGYLVFSRGGGSGATEPVEISVEPAELRRAVGMKMGSDDAAVTLYEFADFQCPACGSFSSFVHPLIKERLVDTGIVQLIRYDFPLVQGHPHAFIAARAGRCAADQERFWEFHDVVYSRQPSWSTLRDPSREFADYAELVGIDRGQFEDCLASDEHAEEVTRNLRLGESLGVNGTPTLMINGQRIDARDYNELEGHVLEAAGMSGPGTPATTPAG